jgi:protease-4
MTRRAKVALVLSILAVIVLLAAVSYSVSRRIPSGSVLVINLSGEMQDQRPSGLMGLRAGDITLQHNVLDAIRAAKDDSRIAGLVVEVGSPEFGWARAQEVRTALLEFRASDKPSICYLQNDTSGNLPYFIATACGEVWMVPTSVLSINGLMAQSLFVRGTLDKLGVYPDMFHIGDYKSAKNMFTEKRYTPAHREMSEWLMRSILEQYVAGAAEARGIEPAAFAEAVRQGPFLLDEARERKLIDRAAYRDEIHEFFREKHGDWKPVSLGKYVEQMSSGSGETIAIVNATGTIVVGSSSYNPLTGFTMGSDSVAADLRRARRDDSVKAIILRVDSGGGSAVASEIIRREVRLAREKKPVVVSMSDVAGSGGYWIAMDANKILAEPSTITASIGVVYGKMNISGLYNLLGLSVDHIPSSENATLFWEQQNFTPAQRRMIEKLMGQIYQDFIAGVAGGRGMTTEAVDKIGRGRVFTGAQALELGLVDELGGVERALAVAKELAEIPADAAVRIVRYPETKTFWQSVFSGDVFAPGVDSSPAGALAELRRWAERSEPIQARMPFELRIR